MPGRFTEKRHMLEHVSLTDAASLPERQEMHALVQICVQSGECPKSLLANTTLDLALAYGAMSLLPQAITHASNAASIAVGVLDDPERVTEDCQDFSHEVDSTVTKHPDRFIIQR
jgi:hypothetical protein